MGTAVIVTLEIRQINNSVRVKNEKEKKRRCNEPPSKQTSTVHEKRLLINVADRKWMEGCISFARRDIIVTYVLGDMDGNLP